MPDSKMSRRRVDMADLMGTDDMPLDDEYFEEKIKEMGDIPAKSISRARMKKPEENIASLADGKVELGTTRDDKMSKLFGTDDIRLDEEFFEALSAAKKENYSKIYKSEKMLDAEKYRES